MIGVIADHMFSIIAIADQTMAASLAVKSWEKVVLLLGLTVAAEKSFKMLLVLYRML